MALLSSNEWVCSIAQQDQKIVVVFEGDDEKTQIKVLENLDEICHTVIEKVASDDLDLVNKWRRKNYEIAQENYERDLAHQDIERIKNGPPDPKDFQELTMEEIMAGYTVTKITVDSKHPGGYLPQCWQYSSLENCYPGDCRGCDLASNAPGRVKFEIDVYIDWYPHYHLLVLGTLDGGPVNVQHSKEGGLSNL